MSDIDMYLSELKSADGNVRNEAVLALCRELVVQDCKDESILQKIEQEMKLVYQFIGPEARCVALDFLGRSLSEKEFHGLVRGELGYAYLQFRMSHSYLVKILSHINDIEFKNSLALGGYFDFDKQMAVAFELLKESGSDALN